MSNLNLVLTESFSLRSEKIQDYDNSRALEVLQKAKALVMALWKGVSIATSQEVADYFEVPIETLASVVKVHREEFTEDGLRVLRDQELKDHKLVFNLCDKSARLTLWSPRSVLRAGMLLRDSEIAKQIRNLLLGFVEAIPTFTDNLTRLEILNLALESEKSRIAAENTVVALEAHIDENKGLVELAKIITTADGNITLGDFAKILGDIGRNEYFDELRQCRIIMIASTLPYQSLIDAGYFEVIEKGKAQKVITSAVVTPKGQAFLARKHQEYIGSN